MIVITLPLPAPCLSPNARPHFMQKARATKAYRTAAFIEARKHKAERWKRATAQATFYKATKRVSDSDNLLASLKSAYDGIADAGIVANDRDLTHKPVVQLVDRANPRVEIELSPS
jgi:crossover junction endodeoxyribonuclease RusA